MDFKKKVIFAGVLIVGIALGIAISALLISILQHKMEAKLKPNRIIEIDENELDPEVWGKNYPSQYDSFMKTSESETNTPHGGSVPYDKLEKNPNLKTLWAGYSFSKYHNEERGHHYALEDQKNIGRITEYNQPGACANCHAAEAPQLIQEMGWEEFNRTPYKEFQDKLHRGTSCADCHDPSTMDLRITRPAFVQAMKRRGVDLTQASRQEMRTYACAQCHVEYYFQGENKVLTFPWDKGLNIDGIEEYYDNIDFKDWTHAQTGAPMIKIQHPEYELWSTGIHAKSGVSCADCHMPYMREGSRKVSDHWIRSPLTNIRQACMTCHKFDEDVLQERVLSIQAKTSELMHRAEEAIVDAIEAIKEARMAGVSSQELGVAQNLHRRASMRWDFVSSENSTGFHSSQESARILANAIDYARQSQLSAREALLNKEN